MISIAEIDTNASLKKINSTSAVRDSTGICNDVAKIITSYIAPIDDFKHG